MANDLWDQQNTRLIEENFGTITEWYRKHLSLKDKEKILQSSYSPMFQYITALEGIQEYLTCKMNFNKIKLVSQLRVTGGYIVTYSKSYYNKINQQELCCPEVHKRAFYFKLECSINAENYTSLNIFKTNRTHNN